MLLLAVLLEMLFSLQLFADAVDVDADVLIHEPFKQLELKDEECKLDAYGGLFENTELHSSVDEL